MKITIFICLALCLSSVFAGTVRVLTQQDIDQILAEHNRIRREVNPPASNMPDLKWDPKIANFWPDNIRDNCVMAHTTNDQRKGVFGYEQLGENLAAKQNWNRNSTIAELHEFWESEKKGWKYAEFGKDCPGGGCGHYTQIIWAKTTHIGCAIIDCPAGNGQFMNEISCNYGPAGNWMTWPGPDYTYIAGTRPEPTNTGPEPTSTGPEPTSTGPEPPTCTPITQCDSGVCGSINDKCDGTLQCTFTCGANEQCSADNQCRSCLVTSCTAQGKTCGSIWNGCRQENCGSCSAGTNCVNDVCVAEPCNPTQTCASTGRTCGTIYTGCGTENCGSCSGSDRCDNSNGVCVALPCNGGCRQYQECNSQSNQCVCSNGYVDDGAGNCKPIQGGGNGPTAWKPLPDSAPWNFLFDLVTSTNQLESNGAGAISWQNAVKYSAGAQRNVYVFDVLTPSTTNFGLGLYYDENDASRVNKLTFSVVNNGFGASVSFKWDIKAPNWGYGSSWSYNPTTWYFSTQTYNKVVVEQVLEERRLSYKISFNGAVYGNTIFTFDNPRILSTVPGMYLHTDVKGTTFKNIAVLTGSTVHVALGQCLSADAWTITLAAALNIDVASITVNSVSDDNGICGGKRQTGAEVGSSFTVTLASDSTISSSAMESSLSNLASQGAPQLSTQVTSYAAAEPTANFAGLTTAAVSGGAVAAGGAGGAAGLSTGAIVGIAVGSGVAGVLVVGGIAAAVTVAAVVIIRKRRSDDYFNQPATDIEMVEKPKRTARFSFKPKKPRTGVNIYDNDPNKHKSITGRVTSAYVDHQSSHVTKD